MNGPISTPALDAMRRSIVDAVKVRTVAQALSLNALKAHYQPIVELKTGTVMGHESLIRGPIDSPFRRRTGPSIASWTCGGARGRRHGRGASAAGAGSFASRSAMVARNACSRSTP